MRLTQTQLEIFWAAATRERPLIVVGAGRWGRTLVDVAIGARSGVRNLALVARHNYDDTCAWRALAPQRQSLIVRHDLASALAMVSIDSQQPVAIIASRPRDHYVDGCASLALGMDTLVEKPLVSNPDDAEALIRTAARKDRLLALGVELALTPVFHYAAQRLSAPVVRAHLEWADPAQEVRHGQVKRAHDEVHVLADDLPHAISIFRLFAEADSRFSLADVHLDSSGQRGTLALTCAGARFSFAVDRGAPTRIRQLRMEVADRKHIDIDFSTPYPLLSIDAQSCLMPDAWTRMASTLRLEIGALFEQVDSRTVRTPLTCDLLEYATLHAAVRDALV